VVVFVQRGETVVSKTYVLAHSMASSVSSPTMTSHVLSISVSRIGYLCQRSKVVQPVQRRLAGDGVDAAHQKVDVVWVSRAQAGGELAANKVGQS
jgi:hypothetical protein